MSRKCPTIYNPINAVQMWYPDLSLWSYQPHTSHTYLGNYRMSSECTTYELIENIIGLIIPIYALARDWRYLPRYAASVFLIYLGIYYIWLVHMMDHYLTAWMPCRVILYGQQHLYVCLRDSMHMQFRMRSKTCRRTGLDVFGAVRRPTWRLQAIIHLAFPFHDWRGIDNIRQPAATMQFPRDVSISMSVYRRNKGKDKGQICLPALDCLAKLSPYFEKLRNS